MQSIESYKDEYPFVSNFFLVNNYRLHYIDEGRGETFLFVHGTPSWSFDYRNIIKAMRDHYRCIAIDHIGFGFSDKPNDYDYSTQNHSKSLEKFIFEMNLLEITLVVHDFGGPIALNFATHFPEKIKRLIILNSWMWSIEETDQFKKMKRVLSNPLIPFLYRYLNFSARFVLPASFGEHRISKKILKYYTNVFQNRYEREACIAFVNSLLTDQDWFESIWDRRNSLVELPVLLIWGMKDKIIGPEYLEKFRVNFPKHSVTKLETVGHFPQEEDWDSCVSAIKLFIKENS